MTVKYGLLTAEDEWASEYEVYDFLYGLVRLLKPKVILETGTYKGGATKAMARAACENGVGYVISCDTDQDRVSEACEWVHDFGKVVTIRCCTGINLISKYEDGEDERIDFAFIDSSGDRVAELEALNLAPGGVVVLHDSNRPQYKKIWEVRPWKSIWHIPTEQGITVFQS